MTPLGSATINDPSEGVALTDPNSAVNQLAADAYPYPQVVSTDDTFLPSDPNADARSALAGTLAQQLNGMTGTFQIASNGDGSYVVTGSNGATITINNDLSGTSTVPTDANGSYTQTVFNADGTVQSTLTDTQNGDGSSSITTTNAAGQVTQSDQFNADGSGTLTTLDPTSGQITETDQLNADGSVSATMFNSSGQTIEQDQFNADGSGTATTLDPTSGQVTETDQFNVNADGSGSETMLNSAGQTIEQDQFNADGSGTQTFYDPTTGIQTGQNVINAPTPDAGTGDTSNSTAPADGSSDAGSNLGLTGPGSDGSNTTINLGPTDTGNSASNVWGVDPTQTQGQFADGANASPTGYDAAGYNAQGYNAAGYNIYGLNADGQLDPSIANAQGVTTNTDTFANGDSVTVTIQPDGSSRAVWTYTDSDTGQTASTLIQQNYTDGTESQAQFNANNDLTESGSVNANGSSTQSLYDPSEGGSGVDFQTSQTITSSDGTQTNYTFGTDGSAVQTGLDSSGNQVSQTLLSVPQAQLLPAEWDAPSSSPVAAGSAAGNTSDAASGASGPDLSTPDLSGTAAGSTSGSPLSSSAPDLSAPDLSGTTAGSAAGDTGNTSDASMPISAPSLGGNTDSGAPTFTDDPSDVGMPSSAAGSSAPTFSLDTPVGTPNFDDAPSNDPTSFYTPANDDTSNWGSWWNDTDTTTTTTGDPSDTGNTDTTSDPSDSYDPGFSADGDTGDGTSGLGDTDTTTSDPSDSYDPGFSADGDTGDGTSGLGDTTDTPDDSGTLGDLGIMGGGIINIGDISTPTSDDTSSGTDTSTTTDNSDDFYSPPDFFVGGNTNEDVGQTTDPFDDQSVGGYYDPLDPSYTTDDNWEGSDPLDPSYTTDDDWEGNDPLDPSYATDDDWEGNDPLDPTYSADNDLGDNDTLDPTYTNDLGDSDNFNLGDDDFSGDFGGDDGGDGLSSNNPWVINATLNGQTVNPIAAYAASQGNSAGVAAANAALAQAQAAAEGTAIGAQSEGAKWADGATVTWSMGALSTVPGGLPFSGSLAEQYQADVAAAFAAWGQATGLNFQQVSNNTPSDITVGVSDFNTASTGIVGYTTTQQQGGQLTGATIEVEDPNQDRLVTNGQNQLIYEGTPSTFEQTLEHEIGHALGFADNSDPNSIMHEQLTTANQNLDGTDKAGAAAMYGQSTAAAQQAAATKPAMLLVQAMAGFAPQPAGDTGEIAATSQSPLAALALSNTSAVR